MNQKISSIEKEYLLQQKVISLEELLNLEPYVVCIMGYPQTIVENTNNDGIRMRYHYRKHRIENGVVYCEQYTQYKIS